MRRLPAPAVLISSRADRHSDSCGFPWKKGTLRVPLLSGSCFWCAVLLPVDTPSASVNTGGERNLTRDASSPCQEDSIVPTKVLKTHSLSMTSAPTSRGETSLFRLGGLPPPDVQKEGVCAPVCRSGAPDRIMTETGTLELDSALPRLMFSKVVQLQGRGFTTTHIIETRPTNKAVLMYSGIVASGNPQPQMSGIGGAHTAAVRPHSSLPHTAMSDLK